MHIHLVFGMSDRLACDLVSLWSASRLLIYAAWAHGDVIFCNLG